MKQLTEEDVEFEIICEPEMEPLEGNLCAHDGDEKCYRWTREQLEQGNIWAWCMVTVIARWNDLEGIANLGACNYKSQTDFKQPGGSYDDMKAEALRDLQAQVDRLSRAICGKDA